MLTVCQRIVLGKRGQTIQAITAAARVRHIYIFAHVTHMGAHVVQALLSSQLGAHVSLSISVIAKNDKRKQ